MKVLLLDIDGGGNGNLDFCLRCIAAGHEVKWFYPPRKDGTETRIGEGLIQRIDNWKKHVDWADIIITGDCTENQRDLANLKKKGYPVFAGTPESAKWELDRGAGQAIFEKNGIKTIPTEEFDSYDDAIQYVVDNPDRYVCKPNGDEPDKSLSYVSKSADDMVYMLSQWKQQKAHKGSFILQKFVKGLEFAVGGWFGPGGFNEALFESFEHKKLMNDELGPNTGEQGTVGRYVTESKLFDMVLKPLAKDLQDVKYVGYVDVNCMVAEDGTPYPLEFTMRFGYPTFQLQQSGHVGDPVQWMLDLINGKDTLKVLMDKVLGCVVISNSEYPYDFRKLRDNEGYPLFFEGDVKDLKNIHPSQIMLGDVPKVENGKIEWRKDWVTAGNYLVTVSGVGNTVEQACKKAYAIVEKFKVPNNMMYRTDIGKKIEKMLPKLRRMGFADGFYYD